MKDVKLYIEPRDLSLLAAVNSFLSGLGVRSYLVGGFLRDTVLGQGTADIDIAVGGDALDIAARAATALGGRYVLLDAANKVGRVVLADDGGRWELDFSAIKGDIEQDLAQRDFTIDAMALDLSQLGNESIELIDPFLGYADLERAVVRVVSEGVFLGDAVRLLRAVRLSAELGFTIDNKTEALMRHNCHLAAGVAGERVREELLRLLAVSGSGRWLHYLDELGLAAAIIPEMEETKGVVQPKEHFWDVFDHSVATVEAVDFLLHEGTWEYAGEAVSSSVSWSDEMAGHFALEVSYGSTRRLILKLGALLHDVAKPRTRTIEEGGRMRFFGHAQQGAAVAATILERLRFSTKEIRLVETLIRHHLRPTQMSHDGLPTHRAVYRYFRDAQEAGIDVLFLSLADHLATRGPRLDPAEWREHVQMVEYVLGQRGQEVSLVSPPKLLSGHDLIDIFGLSPGPRVGELLEAVREAQAAGEVAGREEALAYVGSMLDHPVSSH